MRVLIIDNVDSFVYNLYQYVGELGAEVLVRRNHVSLEEVEAL
ncbi:MAG: anthranilate/aminodeoxychorismate synthase component II, partial [Euryarchaeota archaeon]|nr:anthranilate/aminodeoxychorismate synthase component II [Euryarchaeota archaeon]